MRCVYRFFSGSDAYSVSEQHYTNASTFEQCTYLIHESFVRFSTDVATTFKKNHVSTFECAKYLYGIHLYFVCHCCDLVKKVQGP